MSIISVPISFGELLDKITILEIKSERMTDPVKLANVGKELKALQRIWAEHPSSSVEVSSLIKSLKKVNERLWDIEDDIRMLEKEQRFDEDFIALARSVYFENDDRARIKKELNFALGSAYVEEKSYQDYRTS
jgi:hypothetical protein